MHVRLRATAAATVCSICIAASASVPTIQALSASPEQHRTVSTQAYVLTSNDGTLSPANIGSLASLPGVQTAAAAEVPAWQDPWNKIVNPIVGLAFNVFVTLPINVPYLILTGQTAELDKQLAQTQANFDKVAKLLATGFGLLPSPTAAPAVAPASAPVALSNVSSLTSTPTATAAAAEVPAWQDPWNKIVNPIVGLAFNVFVTLPVNVPYLILTGQTAELDKQLAQTQANFDKVAKLFATGFGLFPSATAAPAVAPLAAPTVSPLSALTPTAAPTATAAAAEVPAWQDPWNKIVNPIVGLAFNVFVTLPVNVPYLILTGQTAELDKQLAQTQANFDKVVKLFATGFGLLPSPTAAPAVAPLAATTAEAPKTAAAVQEPAAAPSADVPGVPPVLQDPLNNLAVPFADAAFKVGILPVALPFFVLTQDKEAQAKAIADAQAATAKAVAAIQSLFSGIGLPGIGAVTAATGVTAPKTALTDSLTTTAATEKTAVETKKAEDTKSTAHEGSAADKPAKVEDESKKPAEHAGTGTDKDSTDKPAKAPAEEPAKPATPAEPATPATPAEPAKPAEEPGKPATPAEPAKPAEPKVNVPKVKLPTPATKVGEVSGGVTPKADDTAKSDKTEKDTKSSTAPAKKSEKESSPAKKPETATSSTGKSETSSSSTGGKSDSGSSHSDSHSGSSE